MGAASFTLPRVRPYRRLLGIIRNWYSGWRVFCSDVLPRVALVSPLAALQRWAWPQILPVDARVELLQLFVAGGQDLLHNVAQQHGVKPSELLRQCIHGVRVHPQPLPNARRARPPPQPVPVRNPLLR